MNLAYITRTVAAAVPEAKAIEARDDGGKVYVLRCELQGRIKSVQFTSAGLYGSDPSGWFAGLAKTDDWIAAQMALEFA